MINAKTLILASLFALTTFHAASASTPSERTHVFEVELLRPPATGAPAILYITFFADVTQADAEKMLKQQLDLVVDDMHPTIDILSRATRSKDGEETTVSGDGAPVYLSAEKKTISRKEYDASHK